MTHPNRESYTVSDEWMAAKAAGTLSEAKQLLLDCQLEVRPSLGDACSVSDHVAGALLESAAGVAMSEDFVARLNERLERTEPERTGHQSLEPVETVREERPDWMPRSLDRYMRGRSRTLRWRLAGPGVERAHLTRTATGERLYLLRARAGFSVPRHTHKGEEWTLILAGGYHEGEQGYAAGDLHQQDETCTHSIRIDDDGPCISLVADEGRLRFSNPLLGLFQPIFGI